MRKFGLIGFPLTHSFSKRYFEEKFGRENISDCSYDLFELERIQQFPSLIKSNPELAGLNVTIPHKESVIQYLGWISNEAKEIGAVNCIKIEGEKLKGYNTDAFGFEVSIKTIFPRQKVAAFILGSGGSSKAVQYVLNKRNVLFQIVSRKMGAGFVSYSDISKYLDERNLIINTTPLGMHPYENNCPDIPYELITPNDVLFDSIYNPSETLFLKKGKVKGAKTKNGLEMLKLQAEKSWEIWNT